MCLCARGGQRSQSLAHILAKIGYKCSHLELGYKGYRKSVVEFLDTIQANFIVISGPTGSGYSLYF
jgi:tRNA 2-selenouridine synthase